jgi:hypothetical protein
VSLPLRSLWPVALAGALGCSAASLVAKDEERFALDLISLVRHHRTDEVLARMEPSLRTPASRSALTEVERLFPDGEPIRVDTVGTYVFTALGSGERTANLTFQLEYASTWCLANVVIRTAGSERSVRSFHVRRLPDSLQRLNAFTLRGKGLRRLSFLAIAALAFASSLAAMVVCARSRIRRKPLWMLVSAFGAGQVLIDWTTGATTTRPLSMHLFSAGMVRANQYAPWILSISLPIGAILFFGFRRRLILQPLVPPATESSQSQKV